MLGIWKITSLASQYFLSDHDAWMKVPFKMQNRPMDFNVTKYNNLLIWFFIPYCRSFLRNYLSSLGIYQRKAIKILLFPTTYLCEDRFYLYKKKVKVLVAQLCPTLCDPMDCNPPSSSVHGILQARKLEGVAIPFSRGSSQPEDWTWVS